MFLQYATSQPEAFRYGTVARDDLTFGRPAKRGHMPSDDGAIDEGEMIGGRHWQWVWKRWSGVY
jgi:hypothetical protein